MDELSWSRAVEILEGDVRTGRAAILVGAGASMLPPTRLPGGPALRDLVMDGVVTSRPARKWWRRLGRSGGYRELLPERVFDHLYDTLGDRLHPFFDVLDRRAPNDVHRVLAYVRSTFGTPLLTTNFDLLLDSLAHPATIDHLHGSLRSPSEMVIRIRQVGKGLDPATQARVGRRLRGRSTWVLGYSGKDEDIMRALGTAQPASIHWLTHGGHDPPLAELSRAVSCHIFRGDLRALARSLRARLKIPSGQPQVTSRSAPRSRPLSRPASKTGEQLACLARVAREARQHRLASEICEAAIPHVTPPNGISWFAVEASTALWMLGDKSDAFAWLDRAANAREEPRLVWRAAIENMRGLVLLDPPAPKPTAARRSFVNAFRANERYLADRRAMWWSRVDAFQARVENNWGLALHALGRYDEAIRLFHRSLRRKRRYGDLLGRSQTAANLAVTYFKIENMRRHRIWRREATSLADRFDLTYQHGEMLREIAELLLARGERTGALAHLEEARDLLESEDRDLALRRRVDGLLARI